MFSALICILLIRKKLGWQMLEILLDPEPPKPQKRKKNKEIITHAN
jgi:hypothetical protein